MCIPSFPKALFKLRGFPARFIINSHSSITANTTQSPKALLPTSRMKLTSVTTSLLLSAAALASPLSFTFRPGFSFLNTTGTVTITDPAAIAYVTSKSDLLSVSEGGVLALKAKPATVKRQLGGRCASCLYACTFGCPYGDGCYGE